MKFSGIGKAQLVAEMREYRAQLRGDVEFFACNVGWYGGAKLDAVKAELSAVCAFLGYLIGKAVKVAQTVTNRPRCAFHKEIRRCFAIAKERGLNVKDESGMRAAICRAFGFTIASRDVLNAGDWKTVGDMVKRGELAW